jgi:hypothetical protein
MRSAARVEEPDDWRAEIERRLAHLEQLERGRGGYAGADLALLHVLASSTQALPFRAADLFRHAAVDDELRAALDGAFIDTVASLGCWLRRMAGSREGVTVERRGRRWRVTHRSHDLLSDDSERP